MKKKGVALISGGLDSILAAKVAMEMGIEVHGLNINTIFFASKKSEKISKAKEGADLLGIPLTVIDCLEEYMDIVRHPKHGYGKNYNPCIDCHIFFLKKAKEFLPQVGADFIITGEVLGQRPMSQLLNSMYKIEDEAGCTGIIMRPLSGALLRTTKMEEEGLWKKRDMLDISGRSRRKQIDLSKEYRLRIKAHSGGGCLLTDIQFSKVISDYIEHNEKDDFEHIKLLRIGRQLRLSEEVKLIVGRNYKENVQIEKSKCIGAKIMPIEEISGPSAILIGNYKEEHVNIACQIVSRYSDGEGEKEIIVKTDDTETTNKYKEYADENIDKLRI